MNSARTIFAVLYEKLLLIVGVLIVLIPISPLNIVQPARDSGVFLYIGWRILHGDVPYLDIWDHKPPMIFFINALGLLLGGGSIWGVWLLELILLFFAALLGFTFIKRYLGSLPAIFSLCIWLLTLALIINGGNLTTEYTLIIQFASLWLAVEAEKKGYFFWRGYMIGILTAVAFLTKQNSIGIGIAIILFLTISRLAAREFRSLLRALLVIVLGGLSVILLLLVFLVLTGAFRSFWDAAFLYNFGYVSAGLFDHLEGSLSGLRLLSNTGLAQLALIGWGAGLTILLFKKKLPHDIVPPLGIALLALPIELLLVGLSGKSYKHYYMALLPIFSIFASLAFYLLLARISDLTKARKAEVFFTIAAIVLLLFTPAVEYFHMTKTYHNPSDAIVAERIREVAAEGESVLLYGAESGLNFTARRRSPTRFVYQYPLYTEGYADQQKIEEFLTDIIEDRPRLIIDSRNPLTPIYEFGITSPKIEESISAIRSHYHFREAIETWTIYEYVDDPVPD